MTGGRQDDLRRVDESPQIYARFAGGLYVITIIAGTIALVFISGRVVANLIATLSYIAVTVAVALWK